MPYLFFRSDTHPKRVGGILKPENRKPDYGYSLLGLLRYTKRLGKDPRNLKKEI